MNSGPHKARRGTRAARVPARTGSSSVKAPFVVRIATGLLVLLALLHGVAGAQDVRSLGMGGVTVPSNSSSVNPAFGAIPNLTQPTSIPLPLGALNALQLETDPNSDAFDALMLFDQATHLTTFVFNPAESPEEIVVDVSGQPGAPTVSISTEGGSPLLLTQGGAVDFGQSFEIPISFDVGPVRLGIRPYLIAQGTFTPDQALGSLFGGGTNSGSVSGVVNGEAGVGVNVAYSTGIELPADAGFPGQLYVGVRAEPFLGLAKATGNGEANISANNAGGNMDLSYDYQASGFYALLGQGGLGFGATADIGVAALLPTNEGVFTAGIALTDLGFSMWNGFELAYTGDSDGNSTETGPSAARRTYVLDSFGVHLNAAFEPELEMLGVSELSRLLVAADASYQNGGVAGHLGGEAGFDTNGIELLARAGIGYDDGLVFGIGTGARFAGVGVDAALHSYRSPFSTNQAIGASLGLSFGF